MTTLDERDELGKVFFAAWQKHRENQLVEPIEAMIIDIILQHPEYHEFFAHPEETTEFAGTNPFLHVSLHLALREQLGADRPVGIKAIYLALTNKLQDAHAAEHHMLDCLGQILWEAQQSGKMPDEQEYLEKLRSL